MKTPTQSQLLAAAGIAIGLAAAGLGVSKAAADTGTGQSRASVVERPNHMQSLVSAIAQKFSLNTSDVQAVFDQEHQKMEAQRKQVQADRINQLVTDGKLAQDQATKITAKMTELATQREANKTAFQSMTEAERHAAMQQQMDSLKTWATDNNIPAQYLIALGGRHHGRHGGPGFNKSTTNDQAPNLAPTTKTN